MLDQDGIRAKIAELEASKEATTREARAIATQLEQQIKERQEQLNRTVNEANYGLILMDGQIQAWREMLGETADAGATQ
jgi:hypothetical protein